MSTDNDAYPQKTYAYEGGVLLGLGLRFLIDAGADDADIFATVAATMNAIRNPDSISMEVKDRFTTATLDLAQEATEQIVREGPHDHG